MVKSKERGTVPKPPSLEELLVPEWKILNEQLDRIFSEMSQLLEDENILPMMLIIAVVARQESGNCIKEREMKMFCSLFNDIKLLAALMPIFLRGMLAVHAKSKEIKFAFSLTQKGYDFYPIIKEKYERLKTGRNL